MYYLLNSAGQFWNARIGTFGPSQLATTFETFEAAHQVGTGDAGFSPEDLLGPEETMGGWRIVCREDGE